jgi:hypothetical protein
MAGASLLNSLSNFSNLRLSAGVSDFGNALIVRSKSLRSKEEEFQVLLLQALSSSPMQQGLVAGAVHTSATKRMGALPVQSHRANLCVSV